MATGSCFSFSSTALIWISKFVQWELKQRHSYSLSETEAFYQARYQTSSCFSWRPRRQRSRCFNSGRGGTPGNSCWGVPPHGSLIFPIRFQTRSLKSVPISDLTFRQKLCYHYLDYSANKKKFFKSISNSHISLSFLLIWNWNDNFIDHTLP